MESILPLLLNTAAGAGGGWLGNMLKGNGLGTIGNVIAGAVGGNALPQILMAAAPALLGDSQIATIATALIGGSAGSLLGGLFKKAA